MRKLLLIGLVVLALAGFGAYMAVNGGSQQRQAADVRPEQPPEQSETAVPENQPVAEAATVKYGDNGFEPATIRIKRGTTVNFVNNTEIPMYVASDPHPQHTAYPEFEAGVALQRFPRPGENFSFTFDKAGTWSYHNHAQPDHMAVITVE